jgi:hypothetical protein
MIVRTDDLDYPRRPFSNLYILDVQSIPLLKALSYGAGSIEADIWLIDDELYVRFLLSLCQKQLLAKALTLRFRLDTMPKIFGPNVHLTRYI